MITTQEVMNTLYKAQVSHVEKFAEALVDATQPDDRTLDGSHLDKFFSFGLLLTHCDKCREPHWFVALSEIGTPLQKAVPEGLVIDLIPAISFEDAVRTYKDLNDAKELGTH